MRFSGLFDELRGKDGNFVAEAKDVAIDSRSSTLVALQLVDMEDDLFNLFVWK